MNSCKENIIGIDFQGWPIYKLTIREIIERLGFQKIENEGNSYWKIEDDNPILNFNPNILTDDGMDYGVDLKRITACDKLFNENGDLEEVNIFIDNDNGLWFADQKLYDYE